MGDGSGRRRSRAALGWALGLAVAASRAAADTRIIRNFASQIDVPSGQSVVLELDRPAERVAIADPEVADVVLVSPRQILVNGRGRRHTAPTGEAVIQEAQTSLIVWDKQGRSDVRTLYVSRTRSEQIELHVTVAELDRSALEAEGYDFRAFNNQVLWSVAPSKIASVGAFAGALTSPVASGPKTVSENVAINSDRATFSVIDLNNNFMAFIELLQREALAKILARPTLLSRSGEEARFRSGGEVPIPLVTNDQVAVQFKEFGAIVQFTPTFADDGMVDLRVTAELSEPDFTLSRVELSGFTIPGFKSRQVNTRVRLRSGQSLLIAGLIRDDEIQSVRKVPYLGDIPVVGALFRNTSFEHKRSELLILVQPVVSAATRDDTGMPLPTDRGPLGRPEIRPRSVPDAGTGSRSFGGGTGSGEDSAERDAADPR